MDQRVNGITCIEAQPRVQPFRKHCTKPLQMTRKTAASACDPACAEQHSECPRLLLKHRNAGTSLFKRMKRLLELLHSGLLVLLARMNLGHGVQEAALSFQT
ncbi:hypothetical protein D3C87_1775120 [compost metagenome]